MPRRKTLLGVLETAIRDGEFKGVDLLRAIREAEKMRAAKRQRKMRARQAPVDDEVANWVKSKTKGE